jgi:branched-chain amino acid aminotransferase
MTSESTTAARKQATAPKSTYNWDKVDFSEKAVNGHVQVQWKRETGWGIPEWKTSPYLNLHVAATGINYGQHAFEGIKAFRTKQNSVHIFRPKENSKRINLSARVASMPELPEELFLDCLLKVVAGNLDWVPPYSPQSSKGALYIRPLLLGSGPRLILGPPDEFIFLVWVTPVGSL